MSEYWKADLMHCPADRDELFRQLSEANLEAGRLQGQVESLRMQLDAALAENKVLGLQVVALLEEVHALKKGEAR